MCPRAKWLVELCELHEVHILNGAAGRTPAPYTCHTGNGESAVDYLCSNDTKLEVNYDHDVLLNQTDHSLLWTSIPVKVVPPVPRGAPPPPAATTFVWEVGPSIKDQVAGIARWKEHSDSPQFLARMQEITGNPALSNSQRSEAMEQLLLDEGESAGVIVRKKKQVARNPNKIGKHLAPWFGEECREAKNSFRNRCKEGGRDSLEAREAFRLFKKTCKRARWEFARRLPDMLKYSPTIF